MAQHASYIAGNGYAPADMMQREADFITPGVLSLSDLAVTAGTSGLTVNVAGAAQGSAGGNAWIPGGYRFYNDAQATVTLAPANATNPRIDLIVAGVDTTTSPYTPTVTSVTGTPAASPAVPAVPATFAGIILAQVAVAANATTISAGNITDKRACAMLSDASSAVSATLTAAGWTGSAAPYTQTVAVAGLGASQNGHTQIADGTTPAQRAAARYANMTKTAQAAGSITITADGTKPSIDIPITIVLEG